MKCSTSLKEIIPSLIKAQQIIKPIPKKGKNPHFKSEFAEYDDVIEAIKIALNANDIWITHLTKFEENKGLIMETSLIHISGEWILTELPIINKAGTDQGLGSSLSYVKRYSIQGLMATATREDDDGEKATPHPERSLEESHEKEFKSMQHSAALITEPQIKRLFAIAQKHNWSNEKIKEFMKIRFGFESTKELNKLNYDFLISQIEKDR